MDIKEIQKRLDGLATSMLAKGLHRPQASFEIRAHVEHRVMINWEPLNKNPYESDIYHFFRDGTALEMFDAAEAVISALPSAEERKFNDFMNALGSVIDLGKANGIEVDALNPLMKTMKRLSENAITYQRHRETPANGAAHSAQNA